MAKDSDNKKPAAEAPKAEHPAAKANRAKKEAASKSGGGSNKKIDAAVLAAAEAPATEPARLKTMYETKVRPQLKEKFGLANPMQHPRLEKIVLNVNMGRHLEGSKLPPNVKATVLDTLVKVTGQKPVVVRAKKSVSNFKLREGFESSAVVTIRRDRMWNFLDRLINLATPRIKDFRGVNDRAFDKQGNYAIGLTEQGVFPEINMAEVTFTHGMNINFCFSKSSPEVSKFVLAELGMPFRKPDEK